MDPETRRLPPNPNPNSNPNPSGYLTRRKLAVPSTLLWDPLCPPFNYLHSTTSPPFARSSFPEPKTLTPDASEVPAAFFTVTESHSTNYQNPPAAISTSLPLSTHHHFNSPRSFTVLLRHSYHHFTLQTSPIQDFTNTPKAHCLRAADDTIRLPATFATNLPTLLSRWLWPWPTMGM